jgi:hypothetical protein
MGFRSRPVVHSAAMKVASVACILLVGLGLSLEAGHLHLNARLGPAKHCSVCLSPHVALASASASPVVSESAQPAAQVTAESSGHVKFHSFSLYNRPPPLQA